MLGKLPQVTRLKAENAPIILKNSLMHLKGCTRLMRIDVTIKVMHC
jgi:hypothetical protein